MNRQRRRRRSIKFRKSVLTLGLLTCFSAVYVWTEDPGDSFYQRFNDGNSLRSNSNYYLDGDSEFNSYHEQASRQLEALTEPSNDDHEFSSAISSDDEFTICDRSTRAPKDISHSLLQQQAATCQIPLNNEKQTLILEGQDTYGRTGNHLQTFFNAMQFARDHKLQVGIMFDSWAMDLLLQFSFREGYSHGNRDDEWQSRIERALCIKIFYKREEVDGWYVVLKNTEDLFRYNSKASPEECKAGYVHLLRTLFRHYNTGTSENDHVDPSGREVKDMCSGIDSLVAQKYLDGRTSANFTVIHLRYLEGKPGLNILANQALHTGCDPIASLEMRPDYVKSILRPLGMMDKPLIVITDHQHKLALGRLMSDPDIRRILHVVPRSSIWFGGDVTLGVTANVFIGNPASTMSLFVARSRAALGFNNNYLFRARNEENGEWYTTCGDECLFKRNDNITTTKQLPVQKGNKSDFLGPRKVPGPSLTSQRAFQQARRNQQAVSGATTVRVEAERDVALETRSLDQVRKTYLGLHPDERARRSSAIMME